MTASAASEPGGGDVERTPNIGRFLAIERGLYYEFIAFTCGLRYSMPLGIYIDSKPMFRVYRGTGLYRALRGGVKRLLLLSPRDPMAFYESVRHTLESRIEWDSGGCPRVSEDLGLWVSCTPTLISEAPDFDVYVCSEFTYVAGVPPPYTRVMGCLVELLVLYTKARAGVLEAGYVEYARWLKWCVERASRGDSRYVSATEEVLRELEEISRGS